MKRILSVLLLAVCATIVYAKEPQQPTSYNYQRGVEAVNNDNDEEGEKYLTKEINENPKNGYAYAWLSSIETRKNELGNAINMLNRALQYLPKNDKYYRAWSYSSLATIYIQLEDTITALNYINKAIKTEPKNTDWWNKRGVIYLYTQQYDLALNDFQKVIDLNPGMVTGYIMTGEVYFEQKRYQEALDMYQFALFLAERSYIYAYMAKAENQLQHYEQAADYVITAFELQHLQEDAADLISQENPELLDELIPRLKIKSLRILTPLSGNTTY
jgi:tetratricopeptide (TPR) repeat protein